MHILHIHYTTEFYLVQCICNSCCCFVWQWYCFYPFSKMCMHSRSCKYVAITIMVLGEIGPTKSMPTWYHGYYQFSNYPLTRIKSCYLQNIYILVVRYFNVVNLVLTKFLTSSNIPIYTNLSLMQAISLLTPTSMCPEEG